MKLFVITETTYGSDSRDDYTKTFAVWDDEIKADTFVNEKNAARTSHFAPSYDYDEFVLNAKG
jgi:hypothetical protein